MSELDAMASISQSLKDFHVDFHKTVASKSESNFVSSALSAQVVLAMAACGAQDLTYEEMHKSLRLPEDRSTIHEGFSHFIKAVNNVKDVELKMVNKIYLSHQYSHAVEDEFKKIVSEHYHSSSEMANFDDGQTSAQQINKWVEDQTNEKIKDLIKSDDLNSNTLMVLVNALYFKGQWLHKFDEKDTTKKTFHLSKSSSVKAPMMYIKKKFLYQRLPELNAQLVGLPYSNQDLMLVVVVPDEVDGLKHIEANLEKINVDVKHMAFSKREVELYLPKFKIETTLDLIPHLQELGMKLVFTEDANLKKMADIPSLRISKVVQKAFIEVNEEGSEAAAATGVQVSFRSLPPPCIKLKVDKPFVYQLIYRDSVLFSGHVVKL
ncbi:antichymotrypsin-2-like isoform X6 [Trichogramma pretiosum]|uniref:antichymotrypsin-2-like isoform X6 n=1 Tax=Trichogramma pretiosum TaxID=7493 RepID=UPI000C718C2C|nr:antichymotrypsin-2-like isoform X6 [Trichogramma pretiosum]